MSRATERAELVTPEEAARLLGLDQVAKHPRRVVLDMVRRGELVRVTVSRWPMITRASIDRYIRGDQ